MSTIIFEHPFNEPLRVLLRLFRLFEQLEHHLDIGGSEWQCRSALLSMVHIVDILGRYDLKKELLKLLAQHIQSLSKLRDNPRVDQKKLEQLLQSLRRIQSSFQKKGGQLGSTLKQDPFLSSIAPKLMMPGSSFECDLPQLHYWLNLPRETRQEKIQDWWQELRLLQSGIQLILDLLRHRTEFRPYTAVQGSFEYTIPSGCQPQLLQVRLEREQQAIPIISANAHQLHIRMVDAQDMRQAIERDLDFELKICAIV